MSPVQVALPECNASHAPQVDAASAGKDVKHFASAASHLSKLPKGKYDTMASMTTNSNPTLHESMALPFLDA